MMLILIYGINFGIGIIVGIIGGRLTAIGLQESITDILSQIASIIINGLFAFGYTSYFLKLSRNEEVTYNELFSKTHLFGPYIAISLLTTVFVVLWSFLFIIPGIIASISYSFVYFVALDYPKLNATKVLQKSKEIINGHKMDFFILNLSFLGWMLLGILTCGILYLWLIPYMEVTIANFYNTLKEKH